MPWTEADPGAEGYIGLDLPRPLDAARAVVGQCNRRLLVVATIQRHLRWVRCQPIVCYWRRRRRWSRGGRRRRLCRRGRRMSVSSGSGGSRSRGRAHQGIQPAGSIGGDQDKREQQCDRRQTAEHRTSAAGLRRACRFATWPDGHAIRRDITRFRTPGAVVNGHLGIGH